MVLFIYYQVLLIYSGGLDNVSVTPFIQNGTSLSSPVNLEENNIGIFLYMYDVKKSAIDINPLSRKHTDTRK